jgi:nucleotide-binding universal stress UspA family protein
MLFFAYDGSINGDWVSHYAIRLAAHRDDRILKLVHVDDGTISRDDLEAKLGRIEQVCARAGVSLETHREPRQDDVLGALETLVPQGRESYLVCGTRVRSGKRGILSGTISEQLLRAVRFNVLAVRVVQPGLLGMPRSLLLPVSGHPRGFQSGLPFLRLFAADVAHLHILLVQRVGRFRFRRLSYDRAERLRETGRAYCQRIERELAEQLGLGDALMDAAAVVSDDVPKEIVIYANQTKSQLIYVGASERNLTQRFLYGNPVEQLLREAPCDVAIYRGLP